MLHPGPQGSVQDWGSGSSSPTGLQPCPPISGSKSGSALNRCCCLEGPVAHATFPRSPAPAHPHAPRAAEEEGRGRPQQEPLRAVRGYQMVDLGQHQHHMDPEWRNSPCPARLAHQGSLSEGGGYLPACTRPGWEGESTETAARGPSEATRDQTHPRPQQNKIKGRSRRNQ